MLLERLTRAARTCGPCQVLRARSRAAIALPCAGRLGDGRHRAAATLTPARSRQPSHFGPSDGGRRRRVHASGCAASARRSGDRRERGRARGPVGRRRGALAMLVCRRPSSTGGGTARADARRSPGPACEHAASDRRRRARRCAAPHRAVRRERRPRPGAALAGSSATNPAELSPAGLTSGGLLHLPGALEVLIGKPHRHRALTDR